MTVKEITNLICRLDYVEKSLERQIDLYGASDDVLYTLRDARHVIHNTKEALSNLPVAGT